MKAYQSTFLSAAVCPLILTVAGFCAVTSSHKKPQPMRTDVQTVLRGLDSLSTAVDKTFIPKTGIELPASPTHFVEPSIKISGSRSIPCILDGGTYFMRSDYICIKRST